MKRKVLLVILVSVILLLYGSFVLDWYLQSSLYASNINIFELRYENVNDSLMKFIEGEVNTNKVTKTITSIIKEKQPNLTERECIYKSFYLYKIAQLSSIDPLLITSICIFESNFNQKAISPKGAIGTMQLMPSTAKSYGVNPRVFEENIIGGVALLEDLICQYDDIKLVLAHYVGGSNPEYKIIYYPEVKEYVDKVINKYYELKGV